MSGKMSSREPLWANTTLDFSKIQYVGFDLDNTLAKYRWPVFSETLFVHALEAIVDDGGYPKELAHCKYDVTFPVKGIWFDTKFGTFLKIGPNGDILKCLVGFEEKHSDEIEDFYSNKSIAMSDRIYVFNTSFQMPELMFFATVIDFLRREDRKQERLSDLGVFVHDQFKPFPNLFRDMRNAIDIVHDGGRFKKQVLDNLDLFLDDNGEVANLLQSLKAAGKKTFMVTNCNFDYSNKIMRYLFSNTDICWEENLREKWVNAFDIIFTQTKKPKFFSGQGNPLSAIDTETGLSVPLECDIKTALKTSGHVFRGGSAADFEEAMEVTDRSAILYVGDHIFGDILKCKKDADWKTLLIVEELDKQITKWEQSQDAINDLKKIEAEKKRLELETVMSLEKNPSSGSFYESKTLNSCGTLELSSMTIRDVSFENLEQQALAKTKEVDSIHGKMGGIFKSGMKETLYSFQTRSYADICAKSCPSLLSYNLADHQFETSQIPLSTPKESPESDDGKEMKMVADEMEKVDEQKSIFII